MNKPELNQNYWDFILDTLEESVGRNALPSVSEVAGGKRDPYRILVSTVLSLRTKDEVTLPASLRLFEIADTPQGMITLTPEEIQKQIFPVGFYKRKSEQIIKISHILLEEYDGKVPGDQKKLLDLPGVGLKTANLVLGLGFGLPYICVDIHVHRISNRLGWCETKSPEETEGVLSRIVPAEGMVRINELMVLFGQKVCRPISPFCSSCPLAGHCPRYGVDRSR